MCPRDAFQKLIPTRQGNRHTQPNNSHNEDRRETTDRTRETEACNHDETKSINQNPPHRKAGIQATPRSALPGRAHVKAEVGHRWATKANEQGNKRHQGPWTLPKTSAQSAKACRQRTSPDWARTLAMWVSLVWKMLTDGESTRP